MNTTEFFEKINYNVDKIVSGYIDNIADSSQNQQTGVWDISTREGISILRSVLDKTSKGVSSTILNVLFNKHKELFPGLFSLFCGDYEKIINIIEEDCSVNIQCANAANISYINYTKISDLADNNSVICIDSIEFSKRLFSLIMSQDWATLCINHLQIKHISSANIKFLRYSCSLVALNVAFCFLSIIDNKDIEGFDEGFILLYGSKNNILNRFCLFDYYSDLADKWLHEMKYIV